MAIFFSDFKAAMKEQIIVTSLLAQGTVRAETDFNNQIVNYLC